VRLFGNEDYERERYDEALVSYQAASVKSQMSLALLNVRVR
jgi:ABC-type transport system involved in Fe-S cluster assembly fused permease/ATPase subunit